MFDKKVTSQITCSICKVVATSSEVKELTVCCSCQSVTEFLDNKWVVVGHYGDEDSYIEIVTAESESVARERFSEFMDSQSEGSEHWITVASLLEQAIERRLGE